MKSDRLYKIFMTSMIVAIAAMLLAMGIISLQKTLKSNLTITINPSFEYRIDYKLDSQEEFLPMFCNTEKDSLGVFVGEGFSLSGAVLSASNLVAENENISFRVYNYTPKPADTTFTHLKMSAGGENMGVAEFSVYANPYEAASPTPNQTTITANASNISIKFKFEWQTLPYTITTEPSNGNFHFVGVSGASGDTDYTANILPADGYNLALAINVHNTDSTTTTLIQDTNYTYDEATGALVIKQASVTGNIVITCTTYDPSKFVRIQFNFNNESQYFEYNRTLDENNSELIAIGSEYSITFIAQPVSGAPNLAIAIEVVGGILDGGAEYEAESSGASNTFKIVDWSKVTGPIVVNVSWLGGCLAPGTLVTLSNGDKKKVEEVTYEDELLVWNFYEGRYDAAVPVLLFHHTFSVNVVVELHFSDGTNIKIIGSHWFLEYETKDWVEFTPYTVDEFVGHNFIQVDNVENNTYKVVALISYEITTEEIQPYSILTAFHTNFVAEDMFNLSLPLFVENAYLVFDIKQNMMYDKNEMEEDITTYGLFTYDEYAEYFTEWEFNALCGPYMKIPVGKGLVTVEEIMAIIKMTNYG